MDTLQINISRLTKFPDWKCFHNYPSFQDGKVSKFKTFPKRCRIFKLAKNFPSWTQPWNYSLKLFPLPSLKRQCPDYADTRFSRISLRNEKFSETVFARCRVFDTKNFENLVTLFFKRKTSAGIIFFFCAAILGG